MAVNRDIAFFKIFNRFAVYRYFITIDLDGNFSFVSIFSCDDDLIDIFFVGFIFFFFILGMDRNRRYQQPGKNDR